MKNLKNLFGRTKRGATSIYIVVFATILFGVVTLSFIRIMLSEAGQSSDDDLSQSAYDSAMAGVEDAKIAVNAYFKCLSEGSGSCDAKNVITDEPDNPNCADHFLLGKVLHSMPDSREVPIIATSTTSASGETDFSDQAYTCVIISDVTPDYRGTLTSDTRTKVIPISVPRDGVTTSYGDAGAKLDDVNSIEFSWYSELNRGGLKSTNYTVSDVFKNVTQATVPPTVQLTFIKVAQGYLNTDRLHEANSNINVINSTMVLLPAYKGSAVTEISANDIMEYGKIGEMNVNSVDKPVLVTCGDGEFACTVRLNTSGLNLHEGDNVFLIASLPYGDPMADFAVTLYDADGKLVKFHGVQISVDSTGRTNQLFRRVETRLDPADLFFPYPQYAVELSGNSTDSFLKKFWITADCWYNQPNSSTGGYCANNGNTY